MVQTACIDQFLKIRESIEYYRVESMQESAAGHIRWYEASFHPEKAGQNSIEDYEER